MISPRIHGVPSSFSCLLSTYVVSPTIHSNSPWNKSFTSLRHSNNCKKLCIRSQGDVSPIPNGNLGNKKHSRNVVGPSALETTPITIESPNDLSFERETGDGIGIEEFLMEKNYFITGATGLLSKGAYLILGLSGLSQMAFSIFLLWIFSNSRCPNFAVFIEKILRMSPAVGKIYVLIRAKDEETAIRRLKEEVIFMIVTYKSCLT